MPPNNKNNAGQVYIVYAGLLVDSFAPTTSTTTTSSTTISPCTALSSIKDSIFYNTVLKGSIYVALKGFEYCIHYNNSQIVKAVKVVDETSV